MNLRHKIELMDEDYEEDDEEIRKGMIIYDGVMQ
jgi:hypothetical protein